MVDLACPIDRIANYVDCKARHGQHGIGESVSMFLATIVHSYVRIAVNNCGFGQSIGLIQRSMDKMLENIVSFHAAYPFLPMCEPQRTSCCPVAFS